MGLGSPEQPDLLQKGPATAEGDCERQRALRTTRKVTGMNCVHCEHPLPGPWCLSQEKPSPELRVGSLVVAKKASGVCDPGERGVVYEQYELGNRPGWSVIFQSGRHDGFSPCDVDFFLDVTGEVCEELTGYTFQNVLRLVDDFDRGDFAPALGATERRPISGRWFFSKQ